jgi:hypothetical protein
MIGWLIFGEWILGLFTLMFSTSINPFPFLILSITNFLLCFVLNYMEKI